MVQRALAPASAAMSASWSTRWRISPSLAQTNATYGDAGQREHRHGALLVECFF
jgi:hypothetical protein